MHSQKICQPRSRLRNFEEHQLQQCQIIGLPGVPTCLGLAIAYEINTLAVVCLCNSVQILNQVTNIYSTWCDCYVIRCYLHVLLFDFVQ